jgi:hypothetical protein
VLQFAQKSFTSWSSKVSRLMDTSSKMITRMHRKEICLMLHSNRKCEIQVVKAIELLEKLKIELGL